MRFEFATATRILFGEGTAASLPELVRGFGSRPLVVAGSLAERQAAMIAAPYAQAFAVSGEPTVDLVRAGAQQAQSAACDLVVSIGGGSAIDAGKAIAAIAANGGEPLDFLEVVGNGRALTAPPLPFIAVPTTAGTGSEVTRNAVLGSPEHGVKAVKFQDMVYILSPDILYSSGFASQGSTAVEPWLARSISRSSVCR